MEYNCWKHGYSEDVKCPSCWKDGPKHIDLFDYNDDTFNKSEKFLISKINELVDYIQELKQ